ncbi:NAD-dependent epimerase/dehydratase [Tanacetum coccineum]
MKLQSSSSIHMNDNNPSTPGKFKMDKSFHNRFRFFHYSSLAKLTFWSFVFLALILVFFFKSPTSSSSSSSSYPLSPSMMTSSKPSMTSSLAASDLYRRSLKTSSWGGPTWEKRVKSSARVRTRNGFCVLVTGASGFVGTHVSVALKRRGDGVLGLDNFNDYYEPSLKRARQALLERSGVYVVEGDINDVALLKKLFELVSFSHVMHLAAQAGVRYAMQNPSSYIHSNIAGFVNLLEICKSANPQPAIVWASSSSVYGLNTKVPFSEKDRTDQPASLYAATKKAGEEIAHTYNHIYGLSLTGLRFFTVYGPWGRPDMAYFFFTKDILKGKPIPIFEGANHGTVARDFTYIDDIVKGCLGALDTAEKSTGSGGKKRGPAQLRVFNLGNTSPVPVSDLVSILERLLKVKAKRMVMKLPRNGDVQFTHANISLAKREFGYKPTTDLQTGLKKFVRWYVSYYGSSKKSDQ